MPLGILHPCQTRVRYRYATNMLKVVLDTPHGVSNKLKKKCRVRAFCKLYLKNKNIAKICIYTYQVYEIIL